MCVKMYFLRFNPIFPLLHVSTFKRAAENSLLLLSICSIGSLFIGSDAAIGHGRRIFERLNKLILATWESLLTSREAVPGIQAALIGQTFAMLSDDPKHWAVAEAFHGTVIACARKVKVFGRNEFTVELHDLQGPRLEEQWKRWVHEEELARISSCLYIHDAELAQCFHHEPFFRHDLRRIPRTMSNELFMAPTAEKWATLMLQSQKDVTPVDPTRFPDFPLSCAEFSSYCTIEGIGASVSEQIQLEELDDATILGFSNDLITWYNNAQSSTIGCKNVDNLCLMPLWHTIFINLFADLDLLERATGRDGTDVAINCIGPVEQWANSTKAQHCALHCLLMLKLLESSQFGTETAIHVPRCLFQGAMSWYCFTRFGHGTGLDPNQRYPEIDIVKRKDGSHYEPYGIASAPIVDVSVLTSFIKLLKKMGPWGIGNRLASILLSLLDEETDGSTVIPPWPEFTSPELS
jgi:hypothetical protein